MLLHGLVPMLLCLTQGNHSPANVHFHLFLLMFMHKATGNLQKDVFDLPWRKKSFLHFLRSFVWHQDACQMSVCGSSFVGMPFYYATFSKGALPIDLTLALPCCITIIIIIVIITSTCCPFTLLFVIVSLESWRA